METDPISTLQFGKPWRAYQERVLKAMQSHLADDKLHVVAAPGAGKTTLGLEAFRRIGRPAIALSPTRSIRDQWITRLGDFLPADAPWPPPWVSTDLSKPGVFTSVTYQALHTKYRDAGGNDDPDEPDNEADKPPTEDELKRIVKLLGSAGVGTIILDEAHHLRSEWWKALTRIAAELPGAKIVSLTATPPYDVTGVEWDKYQELCGAIDEEISVPELVKAGTLCPHQDYIRLVKPLQSDSAALRQYDESADRFCSEMLQDDVFLSFVKAHPWIAARRPDAGEVLDSPELAFAMLSYLRARGGPLPHRLLRILDSGEEDLPRLDRRWWQTLIGSYLAGADWPDSKERKEHRDAVARKLRAAGLLWRSELRLAESRPVRQKLSLSPAKIRACVEICALEHQFRGNDLRQVMLVDFIRDDDTDTAADPGSAPAPLLGAWPLFRELALGAPPGIAAHAALLTGRLAVVHDSLAADLENRLPARKPSFSPLPGLPGYSRVTADAGDLTMAFTEMLDEGKIMTLVATRSLLGEGWDAPCVNSLVLCSFVGSFMLTNQMRGRAIRVNRNCPGKISSIWHLVAADPSTPAGLSDVADLQRRFETFVGLSEKGDSIENGLDRMALDFAGNERVSAGRIVPDAGNDKMTRRLAASAGLGERWNRAIDKGAEGRVVPAVTMAQPPKIRPFHFVNTLRYILYQAFYTFVTAASYVMEGRHPHNIRAIFWLITTGGAIGFLFALPKLARAFILLIRHLPVDGAIHQVALAVRDSLCAAGLIEDDPRRMPVKTRVCDDGSCTVTMLGADFYAQSLFADCLGETLGPIENPRYLVTRRSLGRWIGALDYHAVPQVLGTTRERADIFHRNWLKRVGSGELVYTRAPDSRKLLLRARARSFSAAASGIRRLDRWE